MSKEKFRSMQDQLKPSNEVLEQLYKKIDEEQKSELKSEVKPNRKSYISKNIYKYVSAAVCFVLVLTVILVTKRWNDDNGSSLLGSNTSDPSVELKETIPANGNEGAVSEEGNADSEDEIAIEPRWNEKKINEKFSTIVFNGVEFQINGIILDSDVIGDKVGKGIAGGYDIYEDKTHTINFEVFELKEISSVCALAVKYEGYDQYYPCTNFLYDTETLGDFIDDFNLRQNLVIGKIYYDVREGNDIIMMAYTLPNPSVIWDILLSDPTLPNSGDEHYTIPSMDVSVDVSVLGFKNISLAVNAEGYVQTNINGTGKSFYIGKGKVQEFINYVLENGIGEEQSRYTLSDNSDDEEPESQISPAYNPEKDKTN